MGTIEPSVADISATKLAKHSIGAECMLGLTPESEVRRRHNFEITHDRASAALIGGSPESISESLAAGAARSDERAQVPALTVFAIRTRMRPPALDFRSRISAEPR